MTPFADRSPTPAEHFRLSFFTAVLHLFDQLGPREAAVEEFPFLQGYLDELAGLGFTPETAEGWRRAVRDWEASATDHLPLRALRAACGLDDAAETLLLTAGLLEEDARFGLVFEAAQGVPGQHRPTLALLAAWGRGDGDGGAGRARARRLIDLGLLQVVNPEAPRLGWAVQPAAAAWDAVRGEPPTAAGLRFHPPDQLLPAERFIHPGTDGGALGRLPGLLASGEVGAVAVRGPGHNGRRTALGVVARALGRGLLELPGPLKPDDPRWRLAGPLATLLNALPVAALDLGPGETAHLPRLDGYDGPLGVALGRHGGVTGPGFDRGLTLTLDMPAPAARRRHWQEGLEGAPADLDALAGRFRLAGGVIRRVAGMARAQAALAGRTDVTAADARLAARAVRRQALDALAEWVEPSGDWDDLAVGPETRRELADLEARCRHREGLPGRVGPAFGRRLGPGVRALFTGPSGTGKTLAARLLAAALGVDLYRLDLAAAVSKYIGETEKNLHQALTLAEELDVLLLLDEGDALLGPRTGVQSSNDRYANLETNFLLQRLEAFDGMLLVTTNAGDRIDGAFLRRLDVVVEFRPPEAAERWAIWRAHLPAAHAVEPILLQELSARCTLTGGQIRNAVLHAALLAAENGGVITSGYVEAAVRREYRKAGAVCPLRRSAAARE
jgi:hypothetical protein